jgi:hypothetical protein
MKMRDDAKHIDSSRNLHIMQMGFPLPTIGTTSHPGPTHALLKCSCMLFLAAARRRLICFLRQELENASLGASGTVGSSSTFLTRLGRKILTRPVRVCGKSVPVHRRVKRSVPHYSPQVHRAIVLLSVHARNAEPATCRSRVTQGNWPRAEGVSGRSTQSNRRATSPPTWLRRACCWLSCLGKRVIRKAMDIAVEPVGEQMRAQPLWVLLRQIVEGSHCGQHRCRASRLACLQL